MPSRTWTVRLLFIVGYPTALAVIARWGPVVRERRWRWFAAHEAGMAAIVGGCLLKNRRIPAAGNGAWLLAAAAWYLRASPPDGRQ